MGYLPAEERLARQLGVDVRFSFRSWFETCVLLITDSPRLSFDVDLTRCRCRYETRGATSKRE
jgi:hypothetical protein